jgi:hypothetical protein
VQTAGARKRDLHLFSPLNGNALLIRTFGKPLRAIASDIAFYSIRAGAFPLVTIANHTQPDVMFLTS